MEQLLKLLPEGTAVIAVLVSCILFFKFQQKMLDRGEATLKYITEGHDRARSAYFESLRDIMRSNEQVSREITQRLVALESALDALTAAVKR